MVTHIKSHTENLKVYTTNDVSAGQITAKKEWNDRKSSAIYVVHTN